MAHFAACFAIHRLALNAHLGVPDAERALKQPVELSLRLYFPQAPACSGDDNGSFIDYGELSDTLSAEVARRPFRLIEFMAQELFDLARAYADNHGGKEAALWLQLTKCAPQVAHLTGGASFTLSDLPAGASVVPE